MIQSSGKHASFHITRELVDRQLEAGFSDHVAMVDEQAAWTYGRLHAEMESFGSGLRELGVRPCDRVLILCRDRLEWVAAFLGALRLGAIPVPLNTLLPSGEYEFYFRDSGAVALVVEDDLLLRHEHAWEFPPSLRYLVRVGEGESGDLSASTQSISRGSSPSHISYRDLIAVDSGSLVPPDVHEDDAAFWLYSSGTTGRPKGVVHRQASMVVSADSYAAHILSLSSEDRVFSAAKLFFAYGLGNSLYFPLRFGATSYLFSGRCTPEAVFGCMQARAPTVFFGVPTLYAAMLEHARAEGLDDLGQVRLCVSAGEALPAGVCERWLERFNVEVLDGIGSTELTHIFISNQSGDVMPGSTGRPVPGYEASIRGAHGNECSVGEIGDLWIRCRSSLLEYWNRDEDTASVQVGEWVCTGDKYRVDSQGYYWYAGRRDDMLKVSGNWVSPFEVEEAVSRHPHVLESAVVGVDDPRGLVKPMAFVVLKNGSRGEPGLERSIQKFVKDQLAPYKYPRRIAFVDSLPKTATGKVQRFRLRKLAGDGSV